MSSKLVLEFNDIDGQFHVNDQDGFAFGNGYEPSSAVRHARAVTDKPIHVGKIGALHTACVSEKPDEAISDGETFIQALAEIAGMKVTRLLDDDMNFIGYTMEVI